jgi:putative tryptophan/tyrosine transport system substrate-binding protein
VDRRAFVSTVALGLLAAPLAGEAQQAGKVRIGWLSPDQHQYIEGFRLGLRDLGYVEGQTVVIEERYADGKADRLPGLAAELIRLKVNAIVTSGSAAGLAAKSATTSIPIVSIASDLVAVGLVSSLARPGGNLTGLALMSTDLSPKWLELLREALPEVSRIGVLHDSSASSVTQLRQIEVAAPSLSVRVLPLEAHDGDGIDRVFARVRKENAGALITLSSAVFAAQMRRIVGLAAKHRVPVLYAGRDFVEAGGLMSYGPNVRDVFRQAATYVDKILKGAKPADLPIEQPTKFALVINMKTAKALGLTIPQSLLQRADQVIE